MRLHTPLLALAAAAALAGCYVPTAPDEVLYGVVTATNYKQDETTGQPDPLFANTNTVYLEDTIKVVDDTNSGITINSGVVTGVLDRITADLNARGYSDVIRWNKATQGNPPAGSLRMGTYSLFGSVNLFYSSYWCSWYYYYYCTPTTTYAGSYDYGTLLIEAGTDLYDPGSTPVPGAPSKLIWTGASYGVMSGGSSITVNSPGYQKALAAIDQAFAQSPYFTSAP